MRIIVKQFSAKKQLPGPFTKAVFSDHGVSATTRDQTRYKPIS